MQQIHVPRSLHRILEDEMYMSEIVSMADDLGMPCWKHLPLSELPALNIHWEYGVCYPMGR